MVLRCTRFWTLLGVVLAVFGGAIARAQPPVPAEVPVEAAEPHTEEGATSPPAGQPTVDPAVEKVLERAAGIRGLIEGTLDPEVDAQALFVLDVDMLGPEPLEVSRPVPEVDALSPTGPETAPPEPGLEPEPELPPLEIARRELRAALDTFMALGPGERAARFRAHRDRADEAQAKRQRTQAWADSADRMQQQAEGLEALAAGELEAPTDPEPLLRIDVLSLLEAAEPVAEGESVGPEHAQRLEAAQRLQRARSAWLQLSAEDRTARIAAALEVPEEAPPPPETVPEAFVDEQEAQDREDISDAVEEAADAAREKEEALDVARKARSEALRVVAEERARLLGIKEQQALFAAELPRWKQRARELHESSLEWHRRVDESRGASEANADALYVELRAALDDARAALAEALHRAGQPGESIPAPLEDFNDAELPADVDRGEIRELQDSLLAAVEVLRTQEQAVAWEVAALLRDDVVMLNRDRLLLLPNMSAAQRAELTGLGRPGRAQAGRELVQIGLELRYHAMSLPRDLRSLSSTIQDRPFELVVRLLELICVIALFRWWRSHGDRLLRRWRGPTWAIAQTPTQRIRVTMLGYLIRVRGPFEWLLLLAVLPLVVGTASNAPELRLIWLLLVWVQGARAVILVVDAIADRQTRYGVDTRSHAELRYRSLRLVGLTVTAVGLILSLTSDIVGKGTIYRWVFRGCWILVAPIGLWLVSRWRPIIVTRLEGGASALARWVVGNQTGPIGFVTATVGGLWLLVKGTSEWLVRQFSGLDTTRKVLAYLFRREVARKAQTTARAPRGEPLSGPKFVLLGPESRATQARLLQEPAGELVQDALNLAKSAASTLSVVVGERGMGKSTFLQRVVDRSEETTCIVGCPPEGFEALLEALAVQFGAANYEVPVVAKAIRDTGPSLICIDDAHRMIMPAVGGLEQLDHFTRFALEVGGDVSWMVAVQEAAWHFVERARGERVFFDQVLILPRWTEEQISSLIQRRTDEVGIKASFDQLVVTSQGDKPSEGRRTEEGYYRILWDHSAGNPAVALQAWRHSLYSPTPEGEAVVQLFQEPAATEVENLPPTLLFVLRAIVQLELATAEEVSECTQLPTADVADAIRFSVSHGYVEPTGGRFRLSWTWYRTITRVLTRQHLLVD